MNVPVAFLTVDQVQVIHQRMIAEFGGDPALRDRGLLESAVAMPAAQFGGRYLHGDLPAMAAAYLFHLCRNHAFVDGNKRTALTATLVFLFLNGRRLSASDDELEQLALGVAAGTTTKDQCVAFFSERLRKA